ncbi:hypothetical protein HOK021_66180 [Streptomyces hygroscopicus]|nr:hypothetical protein HOK021_66180 [Streptomyces hygroscopicus]
MVLPERRARGSGAVSEAAGFRQGAVGPAGGERAAAVLHDAGVQISTEQCGRESGLEVVGDRWGCAGCYGTLRLVVRCRPPVAPAGTGATVRYYAVRRDSSGREEGAAGAGRAAEGRARRERISCTARW